MERFDFYGLSLVIIEFMTMQLYKKKKQGKTNPEKLNNSELEPKSEAKHVQ